MNFYGRSSENSNYKFHELHNTLRNHLKAISSPAFVVDGELVVAKGGREIMPFIYTQRVGRKILENTWLKRNIAQNDYIYTEEILAEKYLKPIVFLFDCLYFDKTDYIQPQYSIQHRKYILEAFNQRIGKSMPFAKNPFRLVEPKLFSPNSPGFLEELKTEVMEAKKNGCEGVIIKPITVDSFYSPWSRKKWLKLKVSNFTTPPDTLDLVIMGYTAGSGKRKDTLGAIYVGALEPSSGMYHVVCKVGSGLGDQNIQKIAEMLQQDRLTEPPANYSIPVLLNGSLVLKAEYWCNPRILVEVCFDSFSDSTKYDHGFSLRFPRVVKIRDDKTIDEVDTFVKISSMRKEQIIREGGKIDEDDDQDKTLINQSSED